MFVVFVVLSALANSAFKQRLVGVDAVAVLVCYLLYGTEFVHCTHFDMIGVCVDPFCAPTEYS